MTDQAGLTVVHVAGAPVHDRLRGWTVVDVLHAGEPLWDEARRLGLIEVLDGMPSSARKYCAKVPLSQLGEWVDRLNANATRASASSERRARLRGARAAR